MRTEFVTRTASLLLHNDEHGARPTSGLELFTMGNVAVAYSLRGPGFYQLLADQGLAPFRDVGVDTVLAAVTPVHMRAMRQRLKSVTVQEVEKIRMGDHDFCLVLIRDREKHPPAPTTTESP